MVVDAVTELLETMCLDTPVVLVLEDLHWADESSLVAIQAILHNLAHVPLLVMVTMRPTPRTADLDVLLEDGRWSPLVAASSTPLWTDDFSNILSVIVAR